ncbi:MAG TPA: branched-chain amino acid ABC transporter permease [Acidimicrobiales bacterium]|nr:branched-chain amino acid ABC transporter permease [Acidimicrobiales bacterium]
MSRRPPRLGRGAILAAAIVFGLLPFAGWHLPWVLPGTVDVINSVGTLEVLGLCFVFAVVALGYDVMFGFTGLLSFGQVLYFAAGAYLLDMAMSDWGWPFVPSLAFTVAVAALLAAVLGSVCLRARGIAFAMVTLALAQAGYYLIEDNPHNLTGGDSGLALVTTRLPAWLVGVANTRNLYWAALGSLVLVYALVWLFTESAMGRVWLAIRENERRVEVIGLSPFVFKLAAVMLSSIISAVGGMLYLLLVGTVEPASVASTTVTVSVLVMVVLGGAGRRWGSVLGGMVYVYLQQYLLKVAAEPSFNSLPAVLRDPLSQPEFLLGALFVVFVLFAPGGIAGLIDRARSRRVVALPRVAR